MLTARREAARGFTIVELTITLALVAMLAMLSLPAMSEWVRSTRVHTSAEALQNGLRLAQNEAIRRSRQVVLSFTNDTPGVDAQAVANGINWSIQTVPLPADAEDNKGVPGANADGAVFISGGPMADVTSGIRIDTKDLTALCFAASGGLSRFVLADRHLAPGVDCSQLTGGKADIDVTMADDPTSAKRFRVTASIGGRVRMCNLDRDASKGHADAC